MNQKLKDYFSSLSWWIANLGVVPLFLLAALRRVPIFFFLFARLFFVILVNETTSQLPNKLKQPPFLPLLPQIVKISIAFILISNSYATVKNHHLPLSKGEHKEITIGKQTYFTVGNPEVISYKYRPKKGVLVIKGSKLGFTEITTWTDKEKTNSFHVYVYSKTQHLRLVHLSQQLNNLGLSVTWRGKLLEVSGSISNINSYRQLIKTLSEKNLKQLNLNLRLADDLKAKLLEEVYQGLFDEYITPASCSVVRWKVVCKIPSEVTLPNGLKRMFKQNYGVHFFTSSSISLKRNYQLKMKLIQLEKLDGAELSFGLDKIIGSLGELLDFGLAHIIKRNTVLLKNQNLHLSTLAEPKGIITIGKPLKLNIGQEISFQGLSAKNSEVSTTQWKFVGLKLTFNITKVADYFKVQYQTSFSSPVSHGTQSLNSNFQQSELKAWVGKPIQAFNILYRTTQKSKSSMPLLGKIPILGELFTSKGTRETFKSITGVLLIEEV